MQPLNYVMHKPFIALSELCVLGGQDYFCLEENVVNGGGVISVVDGTQQNGSAEQPSGREDE